MKLYKLSAMLVFSIVFMSILPAESLAKRGFPFGIGMRAIAKKVYTDDTLTVEDLKACLRTENDIENLRQEIEKYDVKIGDSSSKIDKLNENLDYLSGKIDLYSESDVKMYNNKVKSYETMRSQFNEDVNYYNRIVFGMNNSVDSFNRNCSSKKYYEDDMRAAVSAFTGR